MKEKKRDQRAKLEKKLEKKLHKVNNQLLKLRGEVKQMVGESVGNSDLASEGKSDQVHSALNGVKSSLTAAKDNAQQVVTHLGN
jgi:uncharacterized protein YjbJ (UPF0337 family)